MAETTVAEAKNQLPRLIHQAERGEPIHITRRGKPVAVLLSERDYARLCQDQTAQQGFLDFVQTWRTRMAADDLTALTEQEINELRDNAAGRDFSWEQ